jgi:uncharacterized protein
MELYVIPITEDEGNDKFIIFRPLAGLAFVGNRAMADLARTVAETTSAAHVAIGGKAWAFLEEIGYLRPDPFPPAPAAAEFHPTTAVLLMTNQCQLRCRYCYAAAGTGAAAALTVTQGKAAIDSVCRSAQEQGRPKFEVTFHGGGEPTYAWTVMKECVAYARQRSLPAKIGMTSNGVWSPNQVKWILANLDEVSLSFDGTPATQDQQRPFVSGLGSAPVVLRSIAALDQHNFNYGIRMTATAPWEHFPSDVRFICEHTDCQTIQVEPAFNTERGGHCQGDENDYRCFASQFLAAYEIASRAGRRLFYSGAQLGQVTNSFCRAPYDALIVTPGGELVSCYEVTAATHPLARLSTIGTYIDGKVTLDEHARNRLHALMSERHVGCQSCFCYRSCAGDCYTRSFAEGPAGHLVRGPRCRLNQELTRSLLLDGIVAGGGIWRNGQPSRGSEIVPVFAGSTTIGHRSQQKVHSALVVTSWWSNSLGLACLHRLARHSERRPIYVMQGGKSAEQMALFRELMPSGVVELDYPETLAHDDSRMREYLALTLLRDLAGAWFFDHDLLFHTYCEPWLVAADQWFSESRICLCIGEPRNGRGITQPGYWLSPARWPEMAVSFDPVPCVEKAWVRRPDLSRYDGDVVEPVKDTLVRAREELIVRGLCSWFPLTSEAATRHSLPAIPAHAHLGGIHLYTGPILGAAHRPWMEQTVAQFERFFAECPPEWLQAEDPELLRRHSEFRSALLTTPSATWHS